MIELILLTLIATTPLSLPSLVTTPVLPSVTASSPKPTFTPVPAPSRSGSGSQPVTIDQTPPPPPQPQQQEQPKESWADKMWRRYNENKGRN